LGKVVAAFEGRIAKGLAHCGSHKVFCQSGVGARVAARQLALTAVFVSLDAAAQLDTALAAVTRERANALVIVSTGPNILRRHEILEFALRNRLPSVTDMREIGEAGCLLSYMPDEVG
jgi:hypothetical protein